jgi:hypothetical protein
MMIYKLSSNGSIEDTNVILDPGASATLRTKGGSYYFLKDDNAKCYGGVFEVKAGKNVFASK